MNMGFFYSGGFEAMFMLFFLVIAGVFIFVIVSNIRQWNKNNHSPRLTVEADVVAKRLSVSHHSGTENSHSSTSYYVTFQVESGDRMELRVTGRTYGMLAEGDRGRLSFQGTRYLDFTRTVFEKQDIE